MEEIDLSKLLKEDEVVEESLYIDINHTVEAMIPTAIGNIKKIKTSLNRLDINQGWYARWKIKRDCFRIETGIYAVGNPNEQSNVLVTANYKLTFDELRRRLEGLNVWILVLDTKGINVWCAAGKGTFGTEELIRRVIKSSLKRLVSHNKLIVPQLGAPGISAHIVKKYTGFQVVYGPVRAEDINEYFRNGYKTTEEMRKVHFKLKDRIVLTPIEILISLKYLPIILLLFVILNSIAGEAESIVEILQISILNSLPYLGALMVGAFVVPLMLPIIPFRSFALKGAVMGVFWSLIVTQLNPIFMYDWEVLMIIGNSLILTSIVSLLSLNFTGSTTYTSFSGVQKETIIAIPIATMASLVGIVLIVISYF